MSNWRPITSAPLDGSNVDIWSDLYGRITDCFYRRGVWMTGDDRTFFDSITHWMPIPDEPTPETALSQWQARFEACRDKGDFADLCADLLAEVG